MMLQYLSGEAQLYISVKIFIISDSPGSSERRGEGQGLVINMEIVSSSPFSDISTAIGSVL